jgi:aspartyl-tRNA(Asn)/glutamyl-tRNA(Gln) amidotransferase subunit C
MDRDAVAKLALLARLQLTAAELEHLGPQIERILGFVEQLGELDTRDVAPMTAALDVVNRWDDDVVVEGLDRESALANAPRRDEECFLVPPVLGPQ